MLLPSSFLTFYGNIVVSYHNISADYFPQAKNVVYLFLNWVCIPFSILIASAFALAMFSGIQIFYFAFVAACGTCRGKAPPSADADRSPLKSPTGAFIAAQTRAAPNAFSPEGPKPADAVKSLLLLAFTAPCVKKQNWNDRSRSNSAKIKINFPLNMARACGGHFKSSNCTLNRRYPRHAAHRKIF